MRWLRRPSRYLSCTGLALATWLAWRAGLAGLSADDLQLSPTTDGGAVAESETFEKPIRLMAGDKPIQVESPGYACPTMADINGDGKQDLVVGQFNQGHMIYCQNVAAADESPRFAEMQWIKTGEERASVPGVW